MLCGMIIAICLAKKRINNDIRGIKGDMKNIGVFIVVLFVQFIAFGQNPKIDNLEMLFEQGHYKKVFKKANQLLDNPEYDYSIMPTYYKSISLFQLVQNDRYRQKHKNALYNAEELFRTVKKSPDSEKIFNAHMYELIWLKKDLTAWASDMKNQENESEFLEVQRIVNDLFKNVQGVSGTVEVPEKEIVELIPENDGNLGVRDEIIVLASKQLGAPYVWAGASPDGFDCSGFTSYVLNANGESLPRRAVDQYNASRKIKKKNVQKGDLVFFDNGSGVSHVGIVVSEKGEPLKMIHSSSSKGIIITDVSQSEYWSSRLYGYGTFVD